jgi:peptide deformylase
MVRYVVQVGDEVLRKKCDEVKTFDKELAHLLNDMKDTVRAENGAGLAAPQVGIAKRIVVIDVEEGFYELVNPVILSQKGEQTGPEGCLSVKGKQGEVTRPQKVKVEYRDRLGKKHKLTAEGFFARAVCHELDHLDGKLYIDIAQNVYDLTEEA